MTGARIWCRHCHATYERCRAPIEHDSFHVWVRDGSDQAKALAILCRTAAELEPLYDYVPNRPLGWLNLIVDGAIEELTWKVENEHLYWGSSK